MTFRTFGALGMPGAWSSKVQGPVNKSVPPHLTLMYRTGEQRWGYPGDGGFLGMGHAPFRLVGGQGKNLKSDNMVLKGVTLELNRGEVVSPDPTSGESLCGFQHGPPWDRAEAYG